MVCANVVLVVVAADAAVFEAVAEEEVDDEDVVDVDEVVGGTALKLYVAYVAALASPP